LKILIVDDEIASRMKMEKIVSAFSFCIPAKDGKSAMDAFRTTLRNKEYFDLIFLDISMPYVSGIEVLYKIRDLEKRKCVPKEKQAKVIMVTSHSDKEAVITSIQAGCDGYLVKPFDKGMVLEKIKKFFPSLSSP
tara:strand:- start:58 stop:462 length:405 start_codon:yes stop_codon:yes gene_type:complete